MSEEKHLTIQEVNIMYDEILSLRAALATVEQENAELKEVIKELEEEGRKTRLVLLLNHGHSAPYVDDGELQCSQCGVAHYDFLIPPLSELTKRIIFNSQAALAAAQGEVESMKKSSFVPAQPNSAYYMNYQPKSQTSIVDFQSKSSIHPNSIPNLLAQKMLVRTPHSEADE